MSAPIRVMIADARHMENLFVELSSPENPSGIRYYEWGIVSQEQPLLTLTIYPRHDGKTLTFDLDDVITALQGAKAALLGVSGT